MSLGHAVIIFSGVPYTHLNHCASRYNGPANLQVDVDFQDYAHLIRFMFLFYHIGFKADMAKNGYLEKKIFLTVILQNSIRFF